MFLQKRFKQKKRKHSKQKNTLDQNHLDIVEECKEKDKKIKQMKNDIVVLQKKIVILKNKSIVNYNIIFEMEEKIEKLQKTIKEYSTFENEYYINTAHLLFDYYELKENKNKFRKNTLNSSDVGKKKWSIIFFYKR